MFKFYFFQSIRSIKRDKTTFFINLFGLSLGLTFTLLIYLWVNNEYSVDKFHEKDARLYTVMNNWTLPNGIDTWNASPTLMANALKEELPEIEDAVTVKSGIKGFISNSEEKIPVAAQYVSKDFFNVFTFPLQQGDKENVLSDKNDIIISEQLALKLFNSSENVIGRTLEWKMRDYYDYSGNFNISGVFNKLPSNSSQQFDIILNIENYIDHDTRSTLSWGNIPAETYVIVDKEAKINQLDKKINSIAQSKGSWEKFDFFLKKYSSNYLYGKYENGKLIGGRIENIRLFTWIALIILMIACINYMNLSTAKASKRSKEIGVKKTLGAGRKKLILQFFGESLLITYAALLLAILFVIILMPLFINIIGKNFDLSLDFEQITFILLITFLTGVISSSYPALYLSGFHPVKVLKGKLNASFEELWTRKGLVIFQFTCSIVFVIAAIVIYQQMTFVQSKNLGFDKDHIVHIKKEGGLFDQPESFLTEAKKIPGVLNATNSNGEIIGSNNFTLGISWDGKLPDEHFQIVVFKVNYDFFETYDIQFTKGRPFSRKYGSEESKVILNEAAVKAMGLSNPIGEMIHLQGDDVQIVGVTQDFQYQSLYNNVQPCVFKFFPKGYKHADDIWIKIQAGMEARTIEKLKALYGEFNPGYPFNYNFIDRDYEKLYESENRVAILSKYFTIIAVIISCLGLFGLASFTIQNRKKEIGVRKVHGSSSFNILTLLSSDFIRLVIISIVISVPFGYFIMNNWLNKFAYKIPLDWWIFVASGSMAIIIASLTVGSQAIIASNLNPVESLRDE